jgi:hypothetical protein
VLVSDSFSPGKILFSPLHQGVFHSTKILKSTYPSMKVVMFSMIGDEESVNRAMEEGVDGYLPKEIAFDKLMDALPKVPSFKKNHLLETFSGSRGPTIWRIRMKGDGYT